MTFHYVVILMKSVWNKDKNYCYNIFLEKASYELPKKYFFLVKYKCYVMIRIDFSEGIDINNTSASKECDICHYWYF